MLTKQQIYDYAKVLFKKGFYVILARSKEAGGKCKVPIWQGSVKDAKIYSNLKNFTNKLKLTDAACGFGVLTGLLKDNTKLLMCIDNDALNNKEIEEFFIKYFSEKSKKDITKLEEISGFENTLSENGYHIYVLLHIPDELRDKEENEILTLLNLKSSYAFSNTAWKSKDSDTTKDGKVKYGAVELFTINKFIACYPQANTKLWWEEDLYTFDIQELQDFIKQLQTFDNIHTQNNTIFNTAIKEKEKKEKEEVGKEQEQINTNNISQNINNNLDFDFDIEAQKDKKLNDIQLEQIIEATKDMINKKIVNGNNIDMGVVALLMKKKLKEKQIYEIMRELWGADYNETFTKSIIEATKRAIVRKWDNNIYIHSDYVKALSEHYEIYLFSHKTNIELMIEEWQEKGYYNIFNYSEEKMFYTFFKNDENKLFSLARIQNVMQQLCDFFEVSKVLVDDNNHIISYVIKTNNKEFELKAEDLPLSNKILAVLSKHLNVWAGTQTQKLILEYLYAYIEEKDIPKEKVITRTGWKMIDNKYRYLHPNVAKEFLYYNTDFDMAGSFDEEIKALKYVFEKNSPLSFGYIIGLASTLIEPLQLPFNPTIFLMGTAGSGKTSIGLIGLSLFGNQNTLIQSLNSTNNYLEYIQKSHNSTLFVFDENNSVRDRRDERGYKISNIIYTSSFGKSRGRMRDGATAREQVRFYGITCMTSETSLDAYTSELNEITKGTIRRAAMIDMSDMKVDENDVSHVFSILSLNYGNLLKPLINYVEENIEHVKKIYQSILLKLPKAQGLEFIQAVLYTSAYILHKVFNIDLGQTNKLLNEILNQNVKEQLKNLVIDREYLIEQLQKFINTNNAYFVRYENLDEENKKTYYKVFGRIDRENNNIEVYLTLLGLEQFAKFMKMTEKALKLALKNNCLCKSGKDRIVEMTTISIFDVRYKAIKIVYEEEKNEEFEKELAKLFEEECQIQKDVDFFKEVIDIAKNVENKKTELTNYLNELKQNYSNDEVILEIEDMNISFKSLSDIEQNISKLNEQQIVCVLNELKRYY